MPIRPDSGALVTVPDYRFFTKDDDSDSTPILQAIVVATGLVDEHCHRHFGYGAYTETLPVSSNGRVYPTATPIASVSSPDGAIIDGVAVRNVTADAPLDTWTGRTTPPTATVTYHGGYQPHGTTDGATPPLPATVAREIASVAYNLLHPVVLVGVPSGVTSASVGDVSVSSSTGIDLSGISDALDAGAIRRLRGFVKRRPA